MIRKKEKEKAKKKKPSSPLGKEDGLISKALNNGSTCWNGSIKTSFK